MIPVQLKIRRSMDFWGHEIGRHGVRIIFVRAWRRAKYFIAFIGVLFVRLIRPFRLVRFGVLNADRVGHYALNAELYLAEKELGLHPDSIDIFSHGDPRGNICNSQLKIMYDRVFNMSEWAYYFSAANRSIPMGGEHVAGPLNRKSRDIMDVIHRTVKPHISLLEGEITEGRAGLSGLGIPESAKYVCVHVRDRSYLDVIAPGRDWSYHDYRNSDIDNYIPALELLAGKGYYSLRMGVSVGKPLVSTNRYIVDYASGGKRTDLMDVFLVHSCRFMLSTGSGIDALANVFRKPVAYANFIPVQHMATFMPEDIHIFKKMWWIEKKRFMTFREIFEYGIDSLTDTSLYEYNGVEAVENTPSEITALVDEMEARLSGRWEETDEDRDLQSRFWAVFKKDPELHGVCRARVGAVFLRENKDMLSW